MDRITRRRWNADVVWHPRESVARMKITSSVTAVSVPEITPELLSERPAGMVPE